LPGEGEQVEIKVHGTNLERRQVPNEPRRWLATGDCKDPCRMLWVCQKFMQIRREICQVKKRNLGY